MGRDGTVAVVAHRLHRRMQGMLVVTRIGAAVWGLVVFGNLARQADGPGAIALAALIVAAFFTAFYVFLALAATWPVGCWRLIIDWDAKTVETVTGIPMYETRISFDDLRSMEFVHGVWSVLLKDRSTPKRDRTVPILPFHGFVGRDRSLSGPTIDLPSPLDQLPIDLIPWRPLCVRDRARAVVWPFSGILSGRNPNGWPYSRS